MTDSADIFALLVRQVVISQGKQIALFIDAVVGLNARVKVLENLATLEPRAKEDVAGADDPQ